MKFLMDARKKGFEIGLEFQLWGVSCEEFVEVLENPSFMGKQNILRVASVGQSTNHPVNSADFIENKGDGQAGDFTLYLRAW